MTPPPTLPADIHSNPAWHVHDYQPVPRRFIYAALEELQYAETTFLDHRLNRNMKEFFSASFAEMDRAFPQSLVEAQPAAFIFHVGHCGSTLLSRALGATPAVLSLREPMTLNVLASALREMEDPVSWLSKDEWQRLHIIILLALDRRFKQSQLPLVKVTSTCNILLEPVLASHASRRAIALHQPLESCLSGMLRYKDTFSDLRSQSRTRLLEWQQVPGARALRLQDLDPEDIIVLSWLSSMYRFSRALDKYPEQLIRLDFEQFLSDPQSVLADTASFLGLEHAAGQIADTYTEISGFYSKIPGQRFTPADRQYVLDKSRHQNADPIQRGLTRARELIAETSALAACEQYLVQHT